MKVTEQLKSIIKDKQFYSIMECIEFLWLIGYPMEQAYDTSCELYNPILNLDLSNLSNKELEFYSNLNDCHIAINTEYPFLIFYMKKKDIMFYQNLKNRCFYVNYASIWKVFEVQYHMNYNDIQSFIRNLLERGIKLKDYRPRMVIQFHTNELERGIKLKDYTPQVVGVNAAALLEIGVKLKDYIPQNEFELYNTLLEIGVKLKDYIPQNEFELYNTLL